MSGAARSLAFKQFQRALERWPKDPLRPECQLQDVLARRLEKGTLAPPSTASLSGAPKEEAELKQVNALYTLLEDRYKVKYRINGQLLEPRSNPSYYTDLVAELEEAPKRTWFGRMAKRLGGLIRFSPS
ncbi:hypothetical protein QBC46DRAFT_394121 [Diplogelasinospora grovesii]|uniref:Ubiquinol-cytochrome-c reductase complex assembly factor 2 n=1 Tax=Diplogelasinospora grovesii TaxID=303347 RepID=A0AAN6N249_9PEZI|nr:hypothetical protein QBC46DRAFT_394121 [Diplogelasinospora grovesii]